MKKDFDGWNKVKKQTHEERSRLYTAREIWWCKLVDTRRLAEKIGFLEKKVFLELRKAARDMFSDGSPNILPLAGVRPKPTV